MRKRNLVRVSALICLCVTAMAWAGAGDILSSFSTGEYQVYGLDLREENGTTALYAVVQHGTIYRFGINSPSAVKDGSRVAFDSKDTMTGTNEFEGLTGLAICPTWEGPYATEFVGHIGLWTDDRSFRSRWGLEGNPGSLTFAQFGSGLYADADIAPASYAVFHPGVWTTADTDILQYTSYPGWQSYPAAYFTMDKALKGVSLGSNENELWVLTADREILQVSVSGGNATVVSRFFLNSAISNPQGIVYDPQENSLWISDMDYGPNPIYQVSTGRPLLRVDPVTRRVGYLAGQTTINISNGDSGTMDWTAAVVDGGSWLSIATGATGSGAGVVTLSFAENTGAARTGIVRITSAGATGSPRDVTIVQANKPGVGDVLSYFSTGLTGTDGQVYGLAIRALAEGTELHVAAGLKGTVYKFSVDPVSEVKDGSEGIPGDFQQMTDPNVNIMYMKGLAMPPTPEGPYAAQYVAVQDNRAVYRTRWGLEGDPGNLTWSMVNGAWSVAAWGDICEMSRTDTALGGIWTVEGTYVYRYPSYFWSTPWDKQMNIGTGLKGVALGDKSDLWLLTDDNRIMEVSSADGAVIKQFPLSSVISQPSGIEYDGRAGSLWIGNLADNCIYQVAIGEVLSVFPVAQDVDAVAGSVSFDVTNKGVGSMPWTAEVVSGAEWLSITDGTIGTNGGMIVVSYTTNPSATDDRVGTIRVTSAGAIGSPREVTIVQAKNPNPVAMTLTVTPDTQAVGFAAGTTTFDVANGGSGDMAWSAEVISGAEWLHITSGSGTNAGTISVSFDQNDDQAGPRTGTLRITAAGATGSPIDVTVTQAKHPLAGDANLDGRVNFSDYLVLSQNFGSTDAGWEQADFNGDRAVNFSDYLVLSQNFGTGGAVSADEVAQFKAASASLTADEPAEVAQTLPCTPLATVVLAVIGLAFGLLNGLKIKE